MICPKCKKDLNPYSIKKRFVQVLSQVKDNNRDNQWENDRSINFISCENCLEKLIYRIEGIAE